MSATDLVLRPLKAVDEAAWWPLWRGYLAFYRASIPDETSRVTFARLTRGQGPMGGILSWRGPAAVGLVHWITHRTCWSVGDSCYLQDLFVAPEGRGAGTGRRLIAAVEAEARARGCARLHWLTHETNTDAMHLYAKVAERSGFIQFRKALTDT